MEAGQVVKDVLRIGKNEVPEAVNSEVDVTVIVWLALIFFLFHSFLLLLLAYFLELTNVGLKSVDGLAKA